MDKLSLKAINNFLSILTTVIDFKKCIPYFKKWNKIWKNIFAFKTNPISREDHEESKFLEN